MSGDEIMKIQFAMGKLETEVNRSRETIDDLKEHATISTKTMNDTFTVFRKEMGDGFQDIKKHMITKETVKLAASEVMKDHEGSKHKGIEWKTIAGYVSLALIIIGALVTALIQGCAR